jgi:Dickkopf N-terminal cysteine-rich region
MGYSLVRVGGSALAAALLGMLLLGGCGETKKPPHATAGAGDVNSGGDGSDTSGGTASSGGSAANSGGTSGNPGNATDLDSFLEQEGPGFCPRLFRCFEANDDFLGERFVLETVQGCKDVLARSNATSYGLRDLRAQVEAGNIHYVPEQGQKCLADLAQCNGVDSLTQGPCREAFDGNAKTGETCQRDEDCAGDAYCQVPGTCPGQCQPRKKPNESCERDNECAYTGADVFCDHDSGPSPVCRALEPSPKVGKGEPCTRAYTGAGSLTLCQDNLWCATLPGGDPVADALGHCIEPIAGNGACVDSDDVCLDGLCDASAGTCQKYTLRKKAGETCDKALLVICDPLLGLSCNDAGTCEGSGDGTEGSACFSGDFQRGCDPGLYCQKDPAVVASTPGICRAQLPSGAACQQSQSCDSGDCGADQKCLERACFN